MGVDGCCCCEGGGRWAEGGVCWLEGGEVPVKRGGRNDETVGDEARLRPAWRTMSGTIARPWVDGARGGRLAMLRCRRHSVGEMSWCDEEHENGTRDA